MKKRQPKNNNPIQLEKLALLGLKRYGYNRWYDPESKTVYIVVPVKVYKSIMERINHYEKNR